MEQLHAGGCPLPLALLLRSDEAGFWDTASASTRGYGSRIALCDMEPVTRAAWIQRHGKAAATQDEYAEFLASRRDAMERRMVTAADIAAVRAAGHVPDGFSVGCRYQFGPGETVQTVCRILTQHY